MEELYAKWGGIPRYVLEKFDFVDLQLLLDAAIVRADLGQILHYTGESDSPDTNSHKILHMHVCVTEKKEDSYKKFVMELASQYVSFRVIGMHN